VGPWDLRERVNTYGRHFIAREYSNRFAHISLASSDIELEVFNLVLCTQNRLPNSIYFTSLKHEAAWPRTRAWIIPEEERQIVPETRKNENVSETREVLLIRSTVCRMKRNEEPRKFGSHGCRGRGNREGLDLALECSRGWNRSHRCRTEDVLDAVK